MFLLPELLLMPPRLMPPRLIPPRLIPEEDLVPRYERDRGADRLYDLEL